MKDRIRSLAILAVMLMLIIGLQAEFVLAVQTVNVEGKQFVKIEKVSFFDKIRRVFQQGEFTIVGQDSQASAFPDDNWNIGENQCFSADTRTGEISIGFCESGTGTNQNLCSSGHGLFNVWGREGFTNYEKFEMKDEAFVFCSSPSGCYIELYCMPYDFCSSNSQCENRQGTGSKCITKRAVDPIMPLIDFNGNRVTSYKTCTASCTEPDISCWGQDAGVCKKRTYDCAYVQYDNLCLGGFPYDSRSECEDSIDTGPTCGDNSCESGETCSSCSTDCGSCPPSAGGGNGGDAGAGGAAETCGDDICQFSENENTCPSDCNTDPQVDALIRDFSIGDTNGNAIIGPVSPGDELIIKFNVKEDSLREYYIEGGIIPAKLAVDWGMTEQTGAFSILTFFKGDNIENECCDGQKNIQGGTFVFGGLGAGDKPLPREKDIEVKVNVPTSQVLDLCPADFDGDGSVESNDFWADESTEYVAYIVVKNSCFIDGGKAGVYAIKPLTVAAGLDPQVTSGSKLQGESCTDNFECVSGVCEGGFLGLFGKECVGTSAGTISGDAEGTSYINLKKIALTETQISEGTTGDLLASACLSSKECLPGEDEDGEELGSACIKLNKLKEEGVLTQADTDGFFDDAKSTIGLAAVGGATALALCAAPAIPTAGLSLVACTGIGALASAGLAVLGQDKLDDLKTSIGDIFSKDDELTKAIKAGESNTVGICTIREQFDAGAFIESVGEKIKITGDKFVDGLIIILGGLLVLFFLFGALGGKKR